MLKIVDPFSYDCEVAFENTENWVGKVVPNKAWSLRDLVERHSRGLLTDVQHMSPIYHDVDHTSPDMGKVLKSDLHVQELHHMEANEKLAELKKKRHERKGKPAPKPTTPKPEEVITEKEEPEKKPEKL